jgi:hypothetical protein
VAKRAIEIKFAVSDPDEPWKLVSFKKRCEICGDYKDEAFDVCWDPEVRCKREPSEVD